MTPYERLMAEALPTGTFGDRPPPEPETRPPVKPYREPEPDPLAAIHRAQLLKALLEHDQARPRHLRPVTDAA